MCIFLLRSDFGIVLGSRIFIKEGTKAGDNSVQEGDVLLKINNHSVVDGMTLKEARRLIESAKDKLSLTVRRDGSSNGHVLQYSGSSEPTSLHTKGIRQYVWLCRLELRPPSLLFWIDLKKNQHVINIVVLFCFVCINYRK